MSDVHMVSAHTLDNLVQVVPHFLPEVAEWTSLPVWTSSTSRSSWETDGTDLLVEARRLLQRCGLTSSERCAQVNQEQLPSRRR